ncbi:MAG: hypothetical protein HN726_01310 [Candidatus Magasanikbacteria bacterium]|jgi:hypothetical protein|nr:hypothetical protein [Candidatus Magasanikbacteria bacterium]MBT4221145.1 hypothetical protein [Candidatus Magasanikbacteria bacterium]MBT4350285.1 hypothetical protein [Candidatus Magasanikbacteria bacterium]MBT4541711.1 hypothetical protein [Candidatus Magasanikbacteria bacterium]MBT6253312.1 hypothetical protein [Candidatus Magasanikbacteria bacterium]
MDLLYSQNIFYTLILFIGTILIFSPIGFIILALIGKRIDKRIYHSKVSKKDDPKGKGAKYTWRHNGIVLYFSLFLGISFIVAGIEAQINDKGTITAISDYIHIIPNYPLYFTIPIIFILIKIALHLAKRILVSTFFKKPLDKRAQDLTKDISFTLSHDKKTATKDNVTLGYDYINRLVMATPNPLKKSFSLTLDDKYGLYSEIGSLLQEKIHTVHIPIKATKKWIFFVIHQKGARTKGFELTKKYHKEMIAILEELPKELSYRLPAGFTYHTYE